MWVWCACSAGCYTFSSPRGRPQCPHWLRCMCYYTERKPHQRGARSYWWVGRIKWQHTELFRESLKQWFMPSFVFVSCLIFKVSLKTRNGNFNKNPRLQIHSTTWNTADLDSVSYAATLPLWGSLTFLYSALVSSVVQTFPENPTCKHTLHLNVPPSSCRCLVAQQQTPGLILKCWNASHRRCFLSPGAWWTRCAVAVTASQVPHHGQTWERQRWSHGG